MIRACSKSSVRAVLACALAAAIVLPTSASAEDWKKARERVYEVTITNVTKGQVFSPPVLVTHLRSIALFTAGEPASDELALVAEDGDGGPLVDLVSSLPQVDEAQSTSSPLPPGQSAVYRITAQRPWRVLSIVSMLVNTNDAFFAIDSIPLPIHPYRPKDVYADAYDAGSEANNEDCGFIPGPACDGAGAGVRATEGAEGFVHIHNGVHGIADLPPAAYDWRNPVAKIRIVRIR